MTNGDNSDNCFYHFDNWIDNPGDLWHLRHWLQFWQLRTWIHSNLCNSCNVFLWSEEIIILETCLLVKCLNISSAVKQSVCYKSNKLIWSQKEVNFQFFSHHSQLCPQHTPPLLLAVAKGLFGASGLTEFDEGDSSPKKWHEITFSSRQSGPRGQNIFWSLVNCGERKRNVFSVTDCQLEFKVGTINSGQIYNSYHKLMRTIVFSIGQWQELLQCNLASGYQKLQILVVFTYLKDIFFSLIR